MLISKSMNQQMNEQIGHEFGASLQYVSIASYFDDVGLPVLTQHFFRQADEERQHAMKFVRYILDAGGHVAIPAIPAPRHEFTSAKRRSRSRSSGSTRSRTRSRRCSTARSPRRTTSRTISWSGSPASSSRRCRARTCCSRWCAAVASLGSCTSRTRLRRVVSPWALAGRAEARAPKRFG